MCVLPTYAVAEHWQVLLVLVPAAAVAGLEDCRSEGAGSCQKELANRE